MRDSIFYSALRAVVVSFCVVLGLCLGFVFLSMLFGSLSSGTIDTKLSATHTEEILPNALGKRVSLSSTSPVILQVNIEGIIGTEELSEETIRSQLVESREGSFKNDRVKGILLYINTPGGTVTGADGIYRILKEYKERYKIPIYAYVDGLCASGGMYVAMAADKVIASDTSLIGSVGVIAPAFMNVTKLLEKIGVDTMTISAGKGKDAMNPLRPWKPGEEDNYKYLIDFYYNHFVELVTKHRPEISKEQLTKEYGAQIFPAPLAEEYGFIDHSGISLADTLQALVHAAEIPDDEYQVIRLEHKGWWKTLFSGKNNFLMGKVEHRLSISPEIDILLSNQFLYLYTH
jgi:protease IV